MVTMVTVVNLLLWLRRSPSLLCSLKTDTYYVQNYVFCDL